MHPRDEGGGLLCFARLVAHVLAHAPWNRPFLIGVDGLAGSGKTTFAARLVQEMQSRGVSVAVVALDDGFWVDRPPEASSAASTDQSPPLLEDYDWRRLKAEVLDPLRRNSGFSPFSTSTVVIVEGCFVLRDETHGAFDLRIFTHMPGHDGMRRAMQRDGDLSREYYTNYWRQQEDFYIRTHRPLSKAHLIIDGRGPSDTDGWPLAVETRLSRCLDSDPSS